MLFRHLRLLGLLTTLALQTNPPAGDPPAGDPPAGDPPQSDPPASDPPLGEGGESALKAERAARKAAEKAAKDATDELDRLRKEASDRADAEAKEQGKWQELAEKREADLAKATTDLTTATSTIDTLAAYFDAQYQAALKDLPDVIKAFAPAEDAGIAEKTTWLTKATEQAKALEKQQPARGNGANPPPSDGKRDLKAAENAARPRYRV